MRILLLLLAITFFTSCSVGDLVIDEFTLDYSEKRTIVKIIEKDLSVDALEKIVIEEVKLKKIDDNYYLISRHGDKVTATLLIVVENKQLVYGGISCTSANCSYDFGCIPNADGKKCSICTRGNDCVKTVTKEL